MAGDSDNPSNGNESGDHAVGTRVLTRAAQLPTQPCSVVWSNGHAYVLEGTASGTARWVGMDNRGRPEVLTHGELRRRGWTLAG